jgi:hypothetical protein
MLHNLRALYGTTRLAFYIHVQAAFAVPMLTSPSELTDSMNTYAEREASRNLFDD